MARPSKPAPLHLVALVVAALSLAACGDRQPRPTTYTPPATRPGADGADSFVDAPVVDRAAASSLDPMLGPPEAAVVKFLASRVRGDERWREAMAPGAGGERALAEWAEWQVRRFQLRGRQRVGEGAMRVSAWFEIEVDGATDEGEDEFELALVDGVWRILRPPT